MVKELARGDTIVVGEIEDVLVSVYGGDPTARDYDVLEETQTAFASTRTRFFAVSIVTTLSASPKAMELAKTRGIPLARKFEGQLAGSVTILTSTGVGATIARNFLAAFNAISGMKTPMHVSGAIADAFAWMKQQGGPSVGDTHRSSASVEAFVAAIVKKAS